ncbi:TauD/TfdA family dioxygenase [Streptomyces sp. URMC 123]|uniref:TauD/TfdA family dioxygenase n=1 Tax=Streptomyces sp. URMC 123 TaxID=3423403 RepID=UPI003F1CD341
MPAFSVEPIPLTDAAKASATAALTALTDLAELAGRVPDSDVALYLEHGAKQLRNHLPAEVLAALSAWSCAPEPWLTVTDLPHAADHVPTPHDGFCDESRLTVVNLVHFGLLRLLGLTPVAYAWENEGRLIRNVAPRPDAARTNTSWGYARQLDWHTDDSVLDHAADGEPAAAIPHFLSFYGMRNTERVPTELLPVDTVVAALPENVTSELRRPEYAVTAPESYTTDPHGNPLTRTDIPVLWTLPDGHTAMRYGPGRISGQTPWARAALARLEECLAELDGVPVTITAGCFHVFDNRRVLHRRVPFEPAAQGRSRWLRRCYAQRERRLARA